MESYGAILKKAREEKNIEFDIISRETAIARQYLEALENEDDAAFPGEPYLVGFLRNYANYLGVDTEKVLNLYRAKSIQEQPVPEGLIIKQHPKYLVLFIILGVIFALALAVGITLFVLSKMPTEEEKAILLARESAAKKYEMTEKPLKGRFFKGDQFVLSTTNGDVVLTVADTTGVFALETPAGLQYIELSEEVELDIDGNSIPDIIIYVSDVSSAANDRGVEARLLLKSDSNVIVSEIRVNEIPNVAEISGSQITKVILEDTRAYPFTLTASFRGGCIFRYKPDRKEISEDYFTNGEIVNITASNGIRLWFSSGNAVKLQVIANSRTYDLDIAKAGEVVAEDIRWIRDTDGKYKLVVNEIN